jgi:tyrosyl-tRNA synthetase
MKVVTDKNKIDEIFNRGIVAEILPSKEDFFKHLLSGKRLKIYIGADPTSDSLHLSHAKNYMFLEELRQLGHEVIVLVGDFTAQIGDPTGKSEARNQLTAAQVKKNVKKWVSQIKSLISFKDLNNPAKIVYNSQWLSKLSFKDIIPLAANFTVQQMIERDMFEKRWQSNIPIYLHEFFYPLMQGYDSVILDVDAELCGVDQIFNALAGRTLMKRMKNKEKFVIAVNLMANPKTGELMSKSKGTGVFLSSPSNEMFGAIMAQPDEMIEVLFINCTRIPLSEKDKIMALGPREAKARIAFEIVKKIYGEKKAKLAEEEFNRIFQEGNSPSEIKTIKISPRSIGAKELLVKCGLAKSLSEAQRLIEQGAVSLDEQIVKDWRQKVLISKPTILKVGKYHFIKLIP